MDLNAHIFNEAIKLSTTDYSYTGYLFNEVDLMTFARNIALDCIHDSELQEQLFVNVVEKQAN